MYGADNVSDITLEEQKEEGGRRRRAERAPKTKRSIELRGKAITGLCVGVVVLLVITLIFMVFSNGLATFVKDGVSPIKFFTGTTWNIHQTDADGDILAGALPLIAGSFAVTLLSCLIALPFAIGSAIFVVEVAPTFGNKVFRPMVELLTGIPSVVYGLVGLSVIVPWTRSWAGGTGYGVFSSSLVLALMILPTITSLATDAVAAVPDSYRDGSYGLGCTRWQTIVHVVLPSALPGILTAVIMGMSRAFGEALAVQMVIGNAAALPTSLFTPAATLTSILTMGIGNEATGTIYSDALWSLAMVLLAMSLVFILIVHWIGRKGAAKNA